MTRPDGDRATPATAGSAERFGVYIHIPFCVHRCDYCAFATWTDRTGLAPRYLDACIHQAARAVADAPEVTSVFVGGGTPSLVDPRHLGRLIAATGAGPGAEITVECNPDDVTDERLAVLADAGVNRLSIGVQSMDPEVLASLGRTHDPSNVHRAAEAAHAAGIDFNIDVIYGGKGESVESWEATLGAVVALEPVHVSAYALTVEAGTPLAKDPARHPDDDDQATKYRITSDTLDGAGFEWYEISNWARPGHRCVHNLTYWLGGDYAAVGCAAHGYRAGRRYWHVYTPERYIDALCEGHSPVAGSEVLDADAARIERLELLLRTGAGVPIDALDPVDVDGDLVGLVYLADQVAASWGVGSTPRWLLTERGRLLENEVAFRLR
ncbi:MAG TPA: radical SAM family heme chaperone HemW [Acidimicrobiales bacterium]|nr:radical SAM family heme chaperone HemW [Acidimicrobiales bacterium]